MKRMLAVFALVYCAELVASPGYCQSSSVVPARSFVTAGQWACLIDQHRDVYCWLLVQGDFWPTPALTSSSARFEKVPGIASVISLEGAQNYVCALDARGAVHCWGCITTQTCRIWPKQIALARPATQIAVSNSGACALLSDGAVQCWGASRGSLTFPTDNGDLTLTETPATIELPSPAIQLTATTDARCVLDKQGYVTCWGDVCGDESSSATTTKRIAKLSRVSAIAANGSFTCAIVEPQREVRCWGLHDLGQTSLASNVTPAQHSRCTPTPIRHLQHVKQLALGYVSGVALTDDGAVYHWGDYHYGGIRHFGKTIADKTRIELEFSVRPTIVNPEPRTRGRFDQEAQRVATTLKVQTLIHSGDYVCLELENKERRCEWTLSKLPFHIEEVWPDARFETGVPTSK